MSNTAANCLRVVQVLQSLSICLRMGQSPSNLLTALNTDTEGGEGTNVICLHCSHSSPPSFSLHPPLSQ